MPDKNKDEIYQTWAPPQGLWSRWVKPVLFAFTDGVLHQNPAQPIFQNTAWVPAPDKTAIVVDLAGKEGVLWGLQLARLGYRPIPLYNALPWPLNAPISERPPSTVAVEPVLSAICHSTPTLAQISLSPGAPPAFLLDADRRMGKAYPGFFDNRSVCFSTDFPSAEFLRSQGISAYSFSWNQAAISAVTCFKPCLTGKRLGSSFAKSSQEAPQQFQLSCSHPHS